jgi:hypothetical protein
MIHQRQGLTFGFESGDHLPCIHAQLDDLERDPALDRFSLLGGPDGSEPAFPEFLEQFIAPDHGEPSRSVARVESSGRAPSSVSEAGPGGRKPGTWAQAPSRAASRARRAGLPAFAIEEGIAFGAGHSRARWKSCSESCGSGRIHGCFTYSGEFSEPKRLMRPECFSGAGLRTRRPGGRSSESNHERA